MITIRVDANEYIASGHVMRCLSISDALFSLGEDVVFITADDNAKQIIDKRGFDAIVLNSDWNDKEGELDQLTSEIEQLAPDLLLIDSYQVTERYLTELHRKVKTAYIDDLNAFDYPVDIVINYSIYAEDLNYPKNKTWNKLCSVKSPIQHFRTTIRRSRAKARKSQADPYHNRSGRSVSCGRKGHNSYPK